MAGRGWGKTKTGVEDAAWYGLENPESRIALVGPTAADCRDTMVEGISGLLTALPHEMVVDWNRSLGEIILTNGSRYKTFSAEEPERLRGPQFHRAYCDEIAAWTRPETYDMLMFGLRLGNDPRCVITTTPKPTMLLRQLMLREGKDVLITRGRTLDNAANLAPGFIAHMMDKYGGTRLGRQELDAEILDDMPGALWRRADIDATRVKVAPELTRIVVAIDPAVSTNDGSDETGIIGAGKGIDGHWYILADRSGKFTPDAWAREAIALYKLLNADRIIGEVNNGGDMIENTLRNIDRNVSYKAVRASKGKAVRAEPVAALYEQRRCHHVGSLPILEDQMCLASGSLVTTLRGDVPIENVTNSDKVMTRKGWRNVLWAGQTGFCTTEGIELDDGRCLWGTSSHPIFVDNTGFIPLKEVHESHIITSWIPASKDDLSNLEVKNTSSKETAISNQAVVEVAFSYIVQSGNSIKALFPWDGSSIIRMKIQKIILSKICKLLAQKNMRLYTTENQTGTQKDVSFQSESRKTGKIGKKENSIVRFVKKPFTPRDTTQNFVQSNVKRKLPMREAEAVYNLHIDECHEFFANGILVHNCVFTPDYDRNKMGYSPDRMDALVWAMTELAIEQSPGANILEYLATEDAKNAIKLASQPAQKLKPIASQCDFDTHFNQFNQR